MVELNDKYCSSFVNDQDQIISSTNNYNQNNQVQYKKNYLPKKKTDLYKDTEKIYNYHTDNFWKKYGLVKKSDFDNLPKKEQMRDKRDEFISSINRSMKGNSSINQSMQVIHR